MTDDELLQEVKSGIGVTGTYQDNTIKGYITDAKDFLVDAGVSSEVVNSRASVGVIKRGVSDLWNYGSGNGSFSSYFIQRAIQLAYKTVNKATETEVNNA